MSRRKKRSNQKENEGLRLTDKHHPGLAIVSSLLALLSAGLFIAVCCISGESNGNAGIIAGLMGILCVFISIGGFVLAWITLHQDNVRPLFPTIGAVFNGILMVGYLLLYVWGTSL